MNQPLFNELADIVRPVVVLDESLANLDLEELFYAEKLKTLIENE